jgi:nucleoside-diphosphate-sugar epimerase
VLADCTRLQARTGWAPAIALEQTIRDVWDEWRPKT